MFGLRRVLNNTNKAIIHMQSMKSTAICKICGEEFHINNMVKYIQYYSGKKLEICPKCNKRKTK